MQRFAVFSACGRHRWVLGRRWAPGGSTLVVIGLNPSTADGSRDDPTIRRCIDYAKRWGHGRLLVTNLYAFRATKPADLFDADDPVGEANDAWLDRAVAAADQVLVAWGHHGVGARAEAVAARVPEAWALGCTKAGAPRHPLYMRADVLPQRWPSSPRS